MRLLEKTVKRLRKGEEDVEYPDPDVSLPGPAYLPEGYIADSSQKLHLYRRLSKVVGREEVDDMRAEIADRFGALPAEVDSLLDATLLRALGRQLGLERALIRDRSARLSFRRGVTPRLSVLDKPLERRQVEVEVRRLDPLSLVLHRVGTVSLTETVAVSLQTLLQAKEEDA